jgi:hypothetical protein
MFRTRGRRWWLGGAIAAALVVSLAAVLLRSIRGGGRALRLGIRLREERPPSQSWRVRLSVLR